MRSLPRMLRLATAVAMLAATLIAPPSPALAAEFPAPAVNGIYPMVFPVGGDTHFTNTFGAPRSGGRTHEGTDMMADKMVPVVAAASGTIGWVSSTCCALEIEHDDGWSSMYIHLNNDTPGTDDGLGWGIMPGLERGVHVEAGQLIGWVGDSGNAEWTGSHLHFELHTPDGAAISSYEHLLAAQGAAEGRDVAAYVDAGSRFHRPTVLGGVPDSFYFGIPEDVPLMGDWNCNGTRTPAMYRPSNGFVYLTNTNQFGVAESEFFYGVPGDIPLAGDWNGNGCDSFAVYRPSEERSMPATRSEPALPISASRSVCRATNRSPATSTATESTPLACTGCATASSTTAMPTARDSPTSSSSSEFPVTRSWPGTGTVTAMTAWPYTGLPADTSSSTWRTTPVQPSTPCGSAATSR